MKKWQLIGSTTALSSVLLLGACGGAAEKSSSGILNLQMIKN